MVALEELTVEIPVPDAVDVDDYVRASRFVKADELDDAVKIGGGKRVFIAVQVGAEEEFVLH